jgi:hypothetical protein
MAIPNPPFDAIRLCFIAAAAAIVVGTVWWAAKTPDPLWLRATCAGVLGALVLVVLPETLRWLSARQLASVVPSVEPNTAQAAGLSVIASSAISDASEKTQKTTVTEPDDITDASRRVFVDSSITIKQLLEPPANLTSAQKDEFRQRCPGKWINVAGVIKDVGQGRVELVSVEQLTGNATMYLEFDQVKLKQFQLLTKGQAATLIGTIHIADDSFLVIRHCEPV